MQVVPLDSLATGTAARIVALDDTHEDARALRRLGFREGIVIELLSGRDPVLIRCGGACVAIGRRMLAGVSAVSAPHAGLVREPARAAAMASGRPSYGIGAIRPV